MANKVTISVQCEQLLNCMLTSIDVRDIDGASRVFSSDGYVIRRGERADGPEAIRALLRDRPATITTRHLCSNFALSVISGEEASASCCVLLYKGEVEADEQLRLAPAGLVDYSVRYKKCGAEWRISGIETSLVSAL